MQTTRDILLLIGINIRRLRKERKWSQADLALKVDMHRSYVGAIERGGKNISLDKLARLAIVFEIKIEDLFKVDNN